MMSRHFALSSELSGAIAKRLPHAKISFLLPAVSLINSLQIYIYICHGETSNLGEFEVPPGEIKIGVSTGGNFNWSFP